MSVETGCNTNGDLAVTPRKDFMNVVNLLGRLGRDPEISYSQSGMAICKFSLATSEKRSGEQITQWHRCTAFGKTAELIEQYIHKGDQLACEGKIQYGQYDKDGVTRYTTDIIINRIHFVSGGSGGQGNQGEYSGNQNTGQQSQPQQQAYQQPQGQPGAIDPDDIPF